MAIYNDLLGFLLPFIGGGILFAIASGRSKKLAVLKETGLPAEGVVVRMERESGGMSFTLTGSSSDGGSNGKYPVVRFLTTDKEWITARSSHAVHSLYKEGEMVKVYYDKQDPAEFMIESRLNKIIYPAFQAVGIVLMLAGVIVFITKL